MLRNSRSFLQRLGQCAFAAGGGGTLLFNSTFGIHQQKQNTTNINGKLISTNYPSTWQTIDYPDDPVPVSYELPIQETNKNNDNVSQTRQQQRMAVKLSRKINSKVDKSGLDGLRLYQYQTCPYCCKVRAILDYFGFSYEVVEVNPVTRSQIKFSKNYKKVPIITVSSDQFLIESSFIVSVLATFLVRPELTLPDILHLYPEIEIEDPKTGIKTVTRPHDYFVMWGDIPLTAEQIGDIREEREWRQWVDSHFIHLISPNVYRTWKESLETFRWFDKVGDWKRNFPTWERLLAVYAGAAAMYCISKKLKKRHHINDERQEMHKAFDKFLTAKGPHRKFMGGEQPNLADLALFGACNSFMGCTAFMEMRQSDERLGQWFDAVMREVNEGGGRKLLEAKSNALMLINTRNNKKQNE